MEGEVTMPEKCVCTLREQERNHGWSLHGDRGSRIVVLRTWCCEECIENHKSRTRTELQAIQTSWKAAMRHITPVMH